MLLKKGKKTGMKIKRLTAFILSVVIILSLTACGNNQTSTLKEIKDEAGWFTTWTSAALTAGADETPYDPSLKGNTCRQQIRVSIGGDKIKLTFSNEYGDIPVKMESVHIAKLIDPSSPAIDTATDTIITFGGSEAVTIEPGTTVTSDEIAFGFEALDNLAITTKFGNFTGGTITSHTASRCSTWIIEGDHVSDESFTASKVMTSWYFLNRLDVWAEAGTKTIVCIGDSITDGAGSSTNSFTRYSDELARLLQQDPETQNIAVAAKGIGGNSVFGGLGTACKDRFERDVINVPGVRYCILMIGINDIGAESEDMSEQIIEQYKIMINKCHENGIKIYAGTLTPIKGSGYYSELHDKTREKLNTFMLSDNSGFDGVIDFSAALCDSSDPAKIADEYALGNWNDYLHPSEAGYLKMGQTAYEYLKDIIKADNKK